MPRDAFMSVDQVGEFVAREKAKKSATQGMPVDDIPIGDYELGALGRYERVRIDIATSEPALYARYAEALQRLSQAFLAASKRPLPSPAEKEFYQRERLFIMLTLDRQVDGVRRYLTDLWKKQKRSRGS